MKRLIGLAIVLVMLSGCNDGSVRYDCQKPENWKVAKCNPPMCEATGECTKDLFTPEQYDEIKKVVNP